MATYSWVQGHVVAPHVLEQQQPFFAGQHLLDEANGCERAGQVRAEEEGLRVLS